MYYNILEKKVSEYLKIWENKIVELNHNVGYMCKHSGKLIKSALKNVEGFDYIGQTFCKAYKICIEKNGRIWLYKVYWKYWKLSYSHIFCNKYTIFKKSVYKYILGVILT